MRTLYLECNMGAAGDMLMGALYELIPDRDGFIERLNAAGIEGVKVIIEKSVKCGIVGSHIRVFANGIEESEDMFKEHNHEHYYHEHNHEHNEEHHHDHEHNEGHHHEHCHEHDHGHVHHHSHRGLNEITGIIDGLNVSEWVKENAKAVFRLIAEGESHVHGREISDIHFHEVGTLDAVADIVGCCMLIEEIKPERILASNIKTGFGQVRCAHGILPVPAPATAYILRGTPVYSGNIEGELCTPTGAALVKHFAEGFGEMPPMRIEAVGLGMGSKDFEAANCLRAFLGETEDKKGEIYKLCCNLDDMTGEETAYACEKLFEAGALDVYTVPIGMKKGRSGLMFCALCKAESREAAARAMFKHTSTIGVRESRCKRYELEREERSLETAYGRVLAKRSWGYGCEKVKPEFESVKALAEKNGVSIREILDGLKV